MKFPFFSLAILLAVVTASAPLPAPAQSQAPPLQPPIVGGYRRASVKDAEVVKAARFAVQDKAKTSHTKIALLSIQSAEKQLVAGMNYRVSFKAKIRNQPRRVKATIYRDLQGKYSLSEWMVAK